MGETLGEVLQKVERESHGKWEAMGRLVSAADSSKVFGQPVTTGDYTVITAAEVISGGGLGSGMGFGSTPDRQSEPLAESGAGGGNVSGGGGGGGGGGGSLGRPVAAIIVGPDGVAVKPIIDVTKIGLAALTAWGAIGALAIKLAPKMQKTQRLSKIEDA